MRDFAAGILIGLLLSITLILLIMRPAQITGQVIASEGTTMTITLDQANLVESDLRIALSTIIPEELVLESGELTRVAIFARTGPTRIIIPDALASTPLLSERQLHTFSLRFDEPGTYEGICSPCGASGSVESFTITVR